MEDDRGITIHEGHDVKKICFSSEKRWRGGKIDWLNKVCLFCETCQEKIGEPWDERSQGEYEVTPK